LFEIGHTTNLLNLLREYVAARLKPPIPPALLEPFRQTERSVAAQGQPSNGDATPILAADGAGPSPTEPNGAIVPQPSEQQEDITPKLISTTQLAQGNSNTVNMSIPKRYLPEIGRLAKELLRGADEKVGIAVAAYNSVSWIRQRRSMVKRTDVCWL
jgi:hypothetical protein